MNPCICYGSSLSHAPLITYARVVNDTAVPQNILVTLISGEYGGDFVGDFVRQTLQSRETQDFQGRPAPMQIVQGRPIPAYPNAKAWVELHRPGQPVLGLEVPIGRLVKVNDIINQAHPVPMG